MDDDWLDGISQPELHRSASKRLRDDDPTIGQRPIWKNAGWSYLAWIVIALVVLVGTSAGLAVIDSYTKVDYRKLATSPIVGHDLDDAEMEALR